MSGTGKKSWKKVAEGIYRRGDHLLLDFYVKGRRYYQNLGAVTLTDARRIRDGKKAQLAASRAGLTREDEPIPVAALLDARLLERHGHVSAGTLVRYRTAAVHLCRLLEGLTTMTIEADDLREYQRRRLSEGVKAATINREITLLKSSFKLACADGKLSRDPIAHVSHLPEPESDEIARPPSLPELKAIIAEGGMRRGSAWFVPLILTLVGTGERVSAVRSLEVADVDLERETILFPARRRKGRLGKKVARLCPIPPFVCDALASWLTSERRNESPYVFPAPRRYGRDPLPKSTLCNLWTTVCRDAGIDPRPRIHDLRHLTVSVLASRGLGGQLTQRYIGHKSSRMTDRYTHLNVDALRTASDMLEDHFGTEIGKDIEGDSHTCPTQQVPKGVGNRGANTSIN